MRSPSLLVFLRRFGLALGVAAALVLGQQAAVLHELGHATSQIASKGGKPVSPVCDECFVFAPFFGAVGASAAQVAIVPLGTIIAAEEALASLDTAPLLAFRSRAPPAFS